MFMVTKHVIWGTNYHGTMQVPKFVSMLVSYDTWDGIQNIMDLIDQINVGFP